MPGTNWALVANGASAVTAPSGGAGVADTAAIDGNDATGKVFNTNVTWNYLVTLATTKTIDGFRVKLSARLPWRVQQVQDPQLGSTWVTIAQGVGTETGLIALAQAVSVDKLNVAVDVTGQPVTLYTFELWQDSQSPTLTTADLDNRLADWLDTSDGTKAHSGPLQDHATLQTVASQVDSTNTKATGATGFDAIKAVADAIASAVSGLPGTIAGALTTITGQLTTLTGTTAQSGIATIGAISHDLATVYGKTLDTFTGLAGGSTGALSGRTAFPTELWTKVAEVDFTWQKSWDQSADLYVLTVDEIPPYIDSVDVDGAPWRPRLGWWSTRNGDQFGTRRFVDWPAQQLEDAGRRMPGVVVRTQYGCACHLEAWQLT